MLLFSHKEAACKTEGIDRNVVIEFLRSRRQKHPLVRDEQAVRAGLFYCFSFPGDRHAEC